MCRGITVKHVACFFSRQIFLLEKVQLCFFTIEMKCVWVFDRGMYLAQNMTAVRHVGNVGIYHDIDRSHERERSLSRSDSVQWSQSQGDRQS